MKLIRSSFRCHRRHLRRFRRRRRRLRGDDQQHLARNFSQIFWPLSEYQNNIASAHISIFTMHYLRKMITFLGEVQLRARAWFNVS